MNHLPPSVRSISDSGDNGIGYGLGWSVVTNPAMEGNVDSVGEFGWAGAATTKVFIDPKEKMVIVVLTQYVPFDTNFWRWLRRLLIRRSLIEGERRETDSAAHVPEHA